MTGRFVTFEGVEGCGKSTQIARVAATLEHEGFDVLRVREPGGEPLAEAIRRVLLDGTVTMTPRAELLLFLAARAQVVAQVIEPAIEAGRIVLCDRYADSTVAYQGYARGLDLDAVRAMNGFATADLTPDVTVLLDLDPAIGLIRQGDRNRMEQEPLEFHCRVRQGYLAEAARDPGRYRVVDASLSVDAVTDRVMAAVRGALALR